MFLGQSKKNSPNLDISKSLLVAINCWTKKNSGSDQCFTFTNTIVIQL